LDDVYNSEYVIICIVPGLNFFWYEADNRVSLVRWSYSCYLRVFT